MPIEPVGNCQKSGISHGCGYEHSRRARANLLAIVAQMRLVETAFEKSARIDAGRRVRLEEHEVAAVPVGRRVHGRNG